MNNPPQPMESKSEVARLMARVQAEYEASRQAIEGLAIGTSQHKVITAKLERIATVFIEMEKKYGDQVVMEVMRALPGDSVKNNGSTVS